MTKEKLQQIAKDVVKSYRDKGVINSPFECFRGEVVLQAEMLGYEAPTADEIEEAVREIGIKISPVWMLLFG